MATLDKPDAPIVHLEVYQPTWRTQARALLAIARKDWYEYWRYPLNVVSTILQPIIWLTPVYFMGRAFSVNGEARGFAAYSGTSDYMSFILLGSVLAQFVSAVFWGMGFSLKKDMDAGVLESNWMAPVSRPLLLVGRTLTSMLVTAFSSLAMLALAGLLFGFHPTGNALAAFLTTLPVLVGLYGFGFAFAALVLIVREANTMVDMSNFLVQLFTGADFPVTVLPKWLLPVSLAIPLTYGFDAVRAWLLHTRTLIPLWAEIVVLVASMFLFIALGLAAFRALERRVRRLGTLGQH
ncbi:MAG: ABC transporter permease [Anaerolineales bacterium]|jgi:ABC-2 type transport system permease protein